MKVDQPQRIGDYLLLGRLGRGAMGTVYLGQGSDGRQVAVKVARAELADDPRFRERFRREVQMARAVGSAGTAAVVDADTRAPRPWMATEYVPGPTLQEAIERHGPLPEHHLRRLAEGLAEALTAIHRAGLVHRDLKPSNVLLGADGPRVIDFGISRAMEHTALTETGMVFGTPGFLSPEQITGQDVASPSDVFALGAVLVYAATGKGPFGEGPTATLLYKAAHGEPDIDGVPKPLRPLVQKCMHRDPAKRPEPAEVTRLLSQVVTPKAPTSKLPAPMTPAAATFSTSRFVPMAWGGLNLAVALLAAAIADPAAQANGATQLLALAAFCVLVVRAVRYFSAAARRKVVIEISREGIATTRNGKFHQYWWYELARVRVVPHKKRPWVVVWLKDPAPRRFFGAHHGGVRVFPVAHERTRRRRERDVAELRAALAWYLPRSYDGR
ncbi:serine/threonine-protein kinase [Lentzea sp. BCCO 10_0061]|uniref:Serine/threonine-protein kinase n=1 Tax=Lentzea sokolovensis TaxID=3095429 RepID=A0ABU4UNJ1_9PSEU|nr:serine/threonine-protein kinase [Lentzea sp. BCCO 10_0061]MDX8140991.1 serine/threonine-protein kinase [Lentzea sp. BCCO 10_0061]